ncbi:ATP-dependent RNA helicase dbp7, partial [Coelomomyces lativittatus]
MGFLSVATSSRLPSKMKIKTLYPNKNLKDTTKGPLQTKKKKNTSSLLTSKKKDLSTSSSSSTLSKVEWTEEKKTVESIPEVTLTAFTNLGLHPALIHQLYSKFNIQQPTPIQTQVFSKLFIQMKNQPSSFMLNETNALIQSETGSGKTLCYLIPILQTLLFHPPTFPRKPTSTVSPQPSSSFQVDRRIGPLALILVPTRELAQQIHHTIETLLNFSKSHRPCQHWLVSGTLIGGENRKSEKQRLRKGLNLVVSTPGRFLDHLSSTSCLQLDQIRWVVLDEADRLLDMGFQKALFTIFEALKNAPLLTTDHECMATSSSNRRSMSFSCLKKGDPKLHLPSSSSSPSRWVYLCSATIHEKYKILVQQGMIQDPLVTFHAQTASKTTSMSSSLLTLPTSSSPITLHHQYMQVPLKYKLLALFTLLEHTVSKKLIIFFCTKASVNWMYTMVTYFFPTRPCFKLHGDLTQEERKANLSRFQQQPKEGILITTDVAARGLDLPHIDYACQFDPPMDLMEYMHRAGRTARAGAFGTSLLMLLDHEVPFATSVLPQHQLKVTVFPLPLLMKQTWRNLPPSSLEAKGCPETEGMAFLKKKFQFPLEALISKQPKMKELTVEAFRSHIKSYATSSCDH